jgi:YbbR domain-containing protein
MDSLDIEVNLDFSPYLGQNLKWSADKVGIIAAVEKYTEGSFEVPVLIRNIPDSLEIKIFPKKVSVFYQTGLSKFNQVSSSDFVLSADFNKSMELGINYMDVEIEQKSKLVRFVRINPVKLEFLTSVK